MAISLAKGGNISLSKEAPGLSKIRVGLGWDLRVTDGAPFDLDISLFMVKEDGKVRGGQDFIFYNQPKDTAGSVQLSGDNRTGAGDGDDEFADIELGKVPAEIKRLIVCVTIHEAESRGQNFGMVNSAYCRVINQDGDAELSRYDLSEDASTARALVFAEVYRHNDEWKFKAVGQGFEGGLDAMAKSYGVEL